MELVIEITRECNFKCSHCLRGEAQKKDLDVGKLINYIYDNEIDYISSLTLTGGEPFMKMEIINRVFEAFRSTNTTIGFVYIATNGSYLTYDLFKELFYIYQEAEDGFDIEISNSIYHQEERKKLNIKAFKSKDIIEKIKIECFEKNDKYSENILYMLESESFKLFDDNRTYKKMIKQGRQKTGEDVDREIEDLIYFSVNGEIVKGTCDLSFKNIRKLKKD